MQTITRFSDLDLQDEILQALDDMGFERPTEIQREAVRPMLQGRDVIGQAKTGTGKTAAFGLPMVQHCDPSWRDPAVLILVPTRELAEQVAGEIRRIGARKGVKTVAIYGGVGYGPQIDALQEGRPIIVGTPGRTMDHIRKGNIKLDKISMFCLDEADRMMDMGFIDDIRWVNQRIPRSGVQRLLFSATMPKAIMNLAQDIMRDPLTIMVSEDELTVEGTEQIYINVGYRNKVWALYRVLESEDPDLAFVFCRTKREVDKVTGLLKSHGYPVEKLHGDMSQQARNQVMDNVRRDETHIVIATDVLARGIDVSHCSHVINYDLPDDPEWYVHRIGRTSRMGREGKAISFVTSEESRRLLDIEDLTGKRLRIEEVPDPDHLKRDKIKRLMDWKELSDPTGMVHFKVGVGRDQGGKMMRIFKEVNRTCGYHDTDLGTIRVEDDHAVIPVPMQIADRFWKEYRNGELLGQKVQAEILKTEDILP